MTLEQVTIESDSLPSVIKRFEINRVSGPKFVISTNSWLAPPQSNDSEPVGSLKISVMIISEKTGIEKRDTIKSRRSSL
jgi:hypothetical protein